MPAERRPWTRAELLVVFRLYCRTPFGRLHQRNPEIVQLAKQIGRSPAAASMKACNFASLDPQLQARKVKGLGNVSRADRELWEAFLADSESVAQEAEAAYSSLTGEGVDEGAAEFDRAAGGECAGDGSGSVAVSDEPAAPGGPTERAALVKTRRVQSFFRAAVLASYGSRCAITGLAIRDLLNASHIIPWSVDSKRRADPRNGICLNALHDRAFDRGLISFDDELRVIISSTLQDAEECDLHRAQLLEIAGRPLRLPERFHPERTAMEYHREVVFRP